ncbi:hypothetical protein CLV30_12878 [Haloactinopolyspora alba]|uniref:Uncharacterized protein n=1 Tax=Haloactinopolyspora alba TaxID=648780 RepID=A0A2P8DF22_9ACTN|nr:hypothetical protein [Haloactinopolyspora alba]PSK95826.1 hypothetical protein CLV30_12878 [Haloactinopolyspora alba]
MGHITRAQTADIAREQGIDPDTSEAVDVAQFDSFDCISDDGTVLYDEDIFRAALTEYIQYETDADQLAATAAASAGAAVKRPGDFYRPNLVDANWQSNEALDLVAHGLGQLPRAGGQANLRSILLAERALLAGVEDLLAPWNTPCAICGAKSGEPCTADCRSEQERLNDSDDRIGCLDCGALAGQRCRRTCARYADL